MTAAESLASRLANARVLVDQLPDGTPDQARARATVAACEALAPQAEQLTLEEIRRRAAAVAQRRRMQRPHSTAWLALDAEFDVLAALDEDLDPTTREEMGAGSNPRPAV